MRGDKPPSGKDGSPGRNPTANKSQPLNQKVGQFLPLKALGFFQKCLTVPGAILLLGIR